MRSILLCSALTSLLLNLIACSDSSTRPETAEKMKPILVLVNPPAEAQDPTQPLSRENWQTPMPGGVVTLQFHFVGPVDMNLTLASEQPDSLPEVMSIIGWSVGTPHRTNYAGLSHVTIDATAPLPAADQLTSQSLTYNQLGSARLGYAFIVSDGTREQKVAGDFMLYKDKTVAGATNTLFGSTIDTPLADATVGDKKVSISSTLQNAQNEGVKVGWYVSDGKIKNRRAVTTEWELPGSGTYTLVFTVRGKETRNGDIQIRQVSMP